MLLACPAIALESDEFSEGAAEIHYRAVDHQKDEQCEKKDYGRDRQAVLDAGPPRVVRRRLVNILEAALNICHEIVLAIVDRFIRHASRSEREGSRGQSSRT